MGKVTQVSNGDTGLTARTNFNEAMKTVEIDVSLTGDGTSGNALGVDLLDEDNMASDSATQAATQQSIKAYVDSTSAAIPAIKSYTFKSKASNGTEFIAGYYEAATTDANLTQASTTQTYGSANVSYAAHAFIVAGAAGAASGGSGAVTITVTGTSITDAGVRTGSDSETIVADITAMTTDQYIESSKKWLGQVTFTLDVGATGHTTYSADFNYGFAKYDDIGNVNFRITGFEFVGEASGNDTGFNIEVLVHDGTGWTYAATGFTPGGTVLINMNTDHSTESNLSNNEYFAYKRTGLSQDLDGTASEGFVIRITTSANNAVDYMDGHVKFLYL